MNTTSTPITVRSGLLNYFSLFGSLSTLLCCALPSVLVLFGLGASVASTLSFFPWLATLSQHKVLTFTASGVLIACSFVNTHYIVPRFRNAECNPDNPNACEEVSRFSRVLPWISMMLYAVGFLVAFFLGPILSKLDNA